jgi:hypothetical protein
MIIGVDFSENTFCGFYTRVFTPAIAGVATCIYEGLRRKTAQKMQAWFGANKAHCAKRDTCNS